MPSAKDTVETRAQTGPVYELSGLVHTMADAGVGDRLGSGSGAAGCRLWDCGLNPAWGSEETSQGRDTVHVSEEACFQLKEPRKQRLRARGGAVGAEEWTQMDPGPRGPLRGGELRAGGLPRTHLCPFYARDLPQGLGTDTSTSGQTRLWGAGSSHNLQASLSKQVQNRKCESRPRACRGRTCHSSFISFLAIPLSIHVSSLSPPLL